MSLLFLISFAVSAAIIWFSELPYLWLTVFWLVTFLGAFILDRSPGRRAVWINLAALLLALGIGEAYLWSADSSGLEERFEGTIEEDYYIDHPILGYAPARDYRATAKKYVDDHLVYSTLYTTNSAGLRIAPPYNADTGLGSILFFGGSVTYGEGVDDENAMPYKVGMQAKGQYSIYNFAFHGYGPHQMLASLQNGLVKEIVEEPVKLVIYQSIPGHVMRAGGLASWDKHGPRYRLGDDGEARFTGHFDELSMTDQIVNTLGLNQSYLYGRLFGMNRSLRESDYLLYLSIVKTAAAEVRAQFPGSDFQVILWGYPPEYDFERMLEGLTEAGIAVHPIIDILPLYSDRPELYEISQYDPHPNARTHELIANYVTTNLLSLDDD